MAEAVAGPGLDQGFEYLAVDCTEIDTIAEIRQGTERAAIFARGEHGFHCGFAHALNGGETVADHGAVSSGGKLYLRFVDIRGEHINAHRLGFIYQHGQLAGITHVIGAHGGEELHWIMRLEIGGLIGHHGVGGGVGFVEAVAGEFLQQIENLVGLCLGDAVGFLAAGHKALPLFGHFLELLFAHGTP